MIQPRFPTTKQTKHNARTNTIHPLLTVTLLLLTHSTSIHSFSPIPNRVRLTTTTTTPPPPPSIHNHHHYPSGGRTKRNPSTPTKKNHHHQHTTRLLSSSNIDNNNPDDGSSSSSLTNRLNQELTIFSDAASLFYRYVIQTKFQKTSNNNDPETNTENLSQTIVKICDDIDTERAYLESLSSSSSSSSSSSTTNTLTLESLQLRLNALELSRYHLLIKLMKEDYSAYVATASFLSPSRIPRLSLPNIQDVPFNDIQPSTALSSDDNNLVEDCTLQDIQYTESLLDRALLSIFRSLVTKNTGGVSSDQKGIHGLLEQGRLYMLQPNQTDVRQHDMVKETLADLMTPFLPPFYRVFMSGIVPSFLKDKQNVPELVQNAAGKQYGPWFYAPWLTTVVTPLFFGFLVGPSYPNRRKDGERGGLVVEKCKFLQESGCKGLCLNICKIPTQEFFRDELGLDLTVSPNFATQECQWSFGEVPLPLEEDPSFPRGCLVGCESRAVMAETYANTRGSCS